MTHRGNARIAGFTFLFYIIVGVTQMIVARGLPDDGNTAANVAMMAQHATTIHINLVLGLVTGFTALTLAMALYGMTRHEDHDVALLGLSCRGVEGSLIVVPTFATLGLLSLAAGGVTPQEVALAEFLEKVQGWNVTIAATFFAVGSTLFTWLLLRGGMIPRGLGWLGLLASLLLVVILPLRLVGMLSGTVMMLAWVPMAAFEIPLGVWLLIKGGAGGRPAPGFTS